MSFASGFPSPNTRRACGAASSSLVTASRRSSSVASSSLQREFAEARERLADARASSEQLALAALAFVAAVAFLAGRRYLRR
jgi:hypothetical protein